MDGIGVYLNRALKPCMLLAAIGLTLSLIVHIFAWLGMPFGGFAWALHVGIFVVWLPAVLASTRLNKDITPRTAVKEGLRHCPKWMKRMAYLVFYYGWLNGVICMALFVRGGKGKNPDDSTSAIELRMFSGLWMAFYAMALGFLSSAAHAIKGDGGRRCPNGHQVPEPAVICEQCGARVVEPETQGADERQI